MTAVLVTGARGFIGARVLAHLKNAGLPTHAATAKEAHNRLMLTKAFDLSAKLKQPVQLPIDAEIEQRLLKGA